MKKLILLVLLIAAAVGAYLYLHPQLRSGLEQKARHVVPGHDATTLYKWRDADGHWQLSSQPPPPGTPYQTKRYRDDTNVVPDTAITGEPEKH